MEPNRTIADSLKTNTAAMRKRDVINVRQAEKPKAKSLKPTPEQMAKGEFERVIGTPAYRRLPLFETLFKQSGRIDHAGLAALRWYRETHEAAATSPTRCALNDEGRGGGVPICIPFSIAGMHLEDLHYGTRLDMIERRLGALLPSVRAVAVEDKSFSQVAIERFGGRKVMWIDQEKSRATDRKGHRVAYVDKIAPISGRHRQIIADEFAAGLTLLTDLHAPYVSTARRDVPKYPPVTEAEVALLALVEPSQLPAIDPDYLDKAGRMLPYDKLAGVIRARAFNLAA